MEMGIWEFLGIMPEQAASGFYGLVGWAASSVTVRPRGIVEALVSLVVAVVFAEAAADGVAGVIARVLGGDAEAWIKPAALLVGFGGISLMQIMLNRISKQGA